MYKRKSICSDAAARFMFPKKIVDAENYTVIKNGVDYDKHSFKPEVRTELRKKYGLENNFVLGHVGRFNVQKNHEFLIDIFYKKAAVSDKDSEGMAEKASEKSRFR